MARDGCSPSLRGRRDYDFRLRQSRWTGQGCPSRSDGVQRKPLACIGIKTRAEPRHRKVVLQAHPPQLGVNQALAGMQSVRLADENLSVRRFQRFVQSEFKSAGRPDDARRCWRAAATPVHRACLLLACRMWTGVWSRLRAHWPPIIDPQAGEPAGAAWSCDSIRSTCASSERLATGQMRGSTSS